MPNINIYAIRLKPGDDLKLSIQSFIEINKLTAAWICTCVGSLTNYVIRFANQSEACKAGGYFEIVSLTGILSVNGSHLHISISDSEGRTIGGHLLNGYIVYTTAEIVIQSTDNFLFRRENDETTGWKELQIERNDQP